MSFFIDVATTWTEKFVFTQGSANVCGHSSFAEHYVEKSFTVDHFAPFAWLQWQSTLDSAGTDESCKFCVVFVRRGCMPSRQRWCRPCVRGCCLRCRRVRNAQLFFFLLPPRTGARLYGSLCRRVHHTVKWYVLVLLRYLFAGGLRNVKVSTSVNPLFTPFYKSRFHLGQIDGWLVAGQVSGSSTFSKCGTHQVLGGYNAYGGGASATIPLTHLPEHNFATVGVTWMKIDSWCVRDDLQVVVAKRLRPGRTA